MAIAPIYNVSFTNNRINFNGKKHNNENNRMQIPSFVKSIPLATMIAMSPLTSVNAQNMQEPKAKIVATKEFTENNPAGTKGTVLLFSTDGNDNDVEAIACEHVQKIKFNHLASPGKRVPALKVSTYRNYVDTLKTVNYKYKHEDGSPDTQSTQYFVIGPKKYVATVYEQETNKVLKQNSGTIECDKYEITPELFEFLDSILPKNNKVVENKTAIIKDSSDDTFGDFLDVLSGM